MENSVRNSLWVIAIVTFIIGAILGIGWGMSNLFDNNIIESGMETKIGLRILSALMCGSTGLIAMLSFGDYKRRRELEWESNRG